MTPIFYNLDVLTLAMMHMHDQHIGGIFNFKLSIPT